MPPTEDEVREYKATEMVADMLVALGAVLDALEHTQEYRTSHGTHFIGVEGRKLLNRVKEAMA